MEGFKVHLPIILVVVFLVTFVGCGTSGPSVKSSKKYSETENNTLQVQNSMVSLDDYLRRFAGVIVRGSGPYASIRIQGVNSFLMSTDPLFVVDDVKVGRNFSDVYSMISSSDIKSITVLKRAEASIYGVEGANGVIVIQTE